MHISGLHTASMHKVDLPVEPCFEERVGDLSLDDERLRHFIGGMLAGISQERTVNIVIISKWQCDSLFQLG